MRQHAAADFDTMHSVMAELHELQLSVHDAEQVALNSSRAQEAALDFEETVLEQQVKHDTVDVMPTVLELQPIVATITDDEVHSASLNHTSAARSWVLGSVCAQ